MDSQSDVESRRHFQESVDLHKTLCALPGSKGKELSEFVANTALHATGACVPTAMENVLETTKTFMTLINRQGPKAIGFWKHGALPKFMCILDLFGKHSGFFSDGPALIRELCASFYGPVDCGFGNASIMRHEIDAMSKQAEATGISLLLVLSAPWGFALGDRFWRLCTVHQSDREPTRYIDSERVFCSMQRPPARIGSSVLGQCAELVTSDAAVEAMLQEWRAIDVNACDAPEPTPAVKATSAIDQRTMTVMSNVIKTLKEQAKEQQARITELETARREDIDHRIVQAVAQEQAKWAMTEEALEFAMDQQAGEVSFERVRVDALRSELQSVDAEFIPSVKLQVVDFESALSTLRGKLLVSEEELKTCKTRLAESRKRDNDTRKERSQFEALMETRSSELAALRAELEASHQKAEHAKRTASEQVAQLLDKNVEAGKQIETLTERVARLTTALEEANANRAISDTERTRVEAQLKESRLCARWLVAIHVARQRRTAAAEDRGETQPHSDTSTPLVSESVATQNELDRDYLLNLVASAKGLQAHLDSFVDKVQNNSTESPIKRGPTPVPIVKAQPDYEETDFYSYGHTDPHAVPFAPYPYPPQQFSPPMPPPRAYPTYPPLPPRPPPMHVRVRKR